MGWTLRAIAFDMNETVFSLETLRPRFVDAGLRADDLETWFARALRDAFALTATASYTPFPKILESALHESMAQRGVSDADTVQSVLAGLKELNPHPDARAAFERARLAGIDVVAVTNSGEAATRALLQRGNLVELVSMVISVDDVKRSKPSKEVYLHAATRIKIRPEELALVATHPWDVHGAKSAGLITGYVHRTAPFPAFMLTPDATGGSLLDVTKALLKE